MILIIITNTMRDNHTYPYYLSVQQGFVISIAVSFLDNAIAKPACRKSASGFCNSIQGCRRAVTPR